MLLSGEESELVFIDHPSTEMSVSNDIYYLKDNFTHNIIRFSKRFQQTWVDRSFLICRIGFQFDICDMFFLRYRFDLICRRDATADS